MSHHLPTFPAHHSHLWHAFIHIIERIEHMSALTDALAQAVAASTAESEAVLTQLTSTAQSLSNISQQLADLIAAGNSDPAIQTAIDALNAETAKVSAAAEALKTPVAPPATPST